MAKKTILIVVSVVGCLALAAGLGVLIWWLVTDNEEVSVITLEGEGLGTVGSVAAFTRMRSVGDVFWWFYPTLASAGTTRPIILWLDGVIGVSPSLLANFGMFGPYDFNLNRRNDSWIEDYNLLFVDTPIGTGFSTVENKDSIPTNIEENTEHLLLTLETFYNSHEEYSNSPLYIIGQGSGSQLALSIAAKLNEEQNFKYTLHGVVIGNGIISPALALTKLGFYLEELGYIDGRGRTAIETLSNETSTLVNQERYADAFDRFISLGEFVDNNAGAVAVNLGHIVEKLSSNISTRDYFSQKKYLQNVFRTDTVWFMEDVVAPALGISGAVTYDRWREDAIDAARDNFMIPAVELVENILQNTNLEVFIYNGNLDAVSNTPGQLEWIDNLRWDGQENFRNSTRQPLIINRLLEGYFRESDRLKFYWINVAGQSAPLDNPVAMRRVLQRITTGV